MADRVTGRCADCGHPLDDHSYVRDPITLGFPAHVAVGHCKHVHYELGGLSTPCHCTRVPPWKRERWTA